MSLADMGMDVGFSSGSLKSMFKAGSTEDLMEAVGLRNDEIVKRSAAVQQIFAQQEKDQASIAANQGKAGDSSVLVMQAKELSALDTQNKVQDQANKLGINPGQSSELLDQISSEWVSSMKDGIVKRNKLKADLEINPFKNPIDYVVAQVTLDSTVRQAEVANARTGAAQRDMRTIQELTQSLPGQMAAITKTTSDALIQTKLTGARALIDANLTEVQVKNAGVQVEKIALLNGMDQQQLSNLGIAINVKFQAHSQANSDKSLQLQEASARLQQQSEARQQKQFDLGYEMRQEQLTQNKLDRADLVDMVGLVKRGAAGMGIDITKMPDARILQMINSKSADVADYYKAGLASESKGIPVVSLDAGKAARMLKQHNAPMRPEQRSVANLLNDSWEDAQSPHIAQQGAYDPKNIEGVTGGARTQALKKAALMQGNINPADGTNIYAAPALPTVMAVKGVQETQWYKTVMATQMEAGGLKEFNPDQLLSMTANAVKGGKLSYNDAVKGLQNTFTAAVAINNATKNYEGVGLPPQGSFNSKIPDSTGSHQKYNLLTPQDLTRALGTKLRDNDPNKQILSRSLLN